MRICLIFVCLALVSCAPQTEYIRADGQYVSQQQAEADRAACATNDRFCMVEKGYFLVPKDQAAAKSAQLAAIADEERQQAELAAQAEAKRKAAEKKKRKRSTAGAGAKQSTAGAGTKQSTAGAGTKQSIAGAGFKQGTAGAATQSTFDQQ